MTTPQQPNAGELLYGRLFARSARGATFSRLFDRKTVVFGLQAFCLAELIERWKRDFFDLPRAQAISTAQPRVDAVLGAGTVQADRIGALHDLGYLPLLIKALPEGTRVDLNITFVTVQNTHGAFGWLSKMVMQSLADALWKPITVATIAYEFHRVQQQFAATTGAPTNITPWQLHDAASAEDPAYADVASAAAGHLLCHFNTDASHAINHLVRYYFVDPNLELVGASVPLPQSVLLHFDLLGGNGARRGSSLNFWTYLGNQARAIKDSMLAVDGITPVAVQLDILTGDGDPALILCGDARAPAGTPEQKGAVEFLWDILGGTMNEKGFRMLSEHVRLTCDGITLEQQYRILARLARNDFSSANVVLNFHPDVYYATTSKTFGVTSWACAPDIAAGLVRVEHNGQRYVAHQHQTPEQEDEGELLPVFLDSFMINAQSLSELRARLGAMP